VTDDVVVVPANAASWAELTAVLDAARCHGGRCHCQRFKLPARDWAGVDDDERAHRLRAQTDCGHPESGATSGLLARVGGEPAAWCAVEPRTGYPGLRTSRVLWPGRTEDKDDPAVWAVTCFAVRPEFRGRGLTHVLAAAAVEHARAHGATALEGYPMLTTPGQLVTWGEMHVGSLAAFTSAGFTVVSTPTKRRSVVRIEL
jgi:GNAT superfamily N-acetyltransferase